MSWVKLDDQFFAHPKVVRLSRDAKLLYIAGLTYCSSQLTDGRVGRAALRLVGALADVPGDAAAELVESGLWGPCEDGYLIHDYLEYNPTAEKVKEQRAANAKRQADWRERLGGVSGGVTNAAEHYAVTNDPTNESTNSVSNGPVTAPRPDPGPSRPTDVKASATADAMAAAAPSPEARQLIERWRAAHGKKKPPSLNPTQLQTLEAAIPDLGMERLEEAVDWSAQNGVPAFIKAVRGAYTKRQQEEAAYAEAERPRAPSYGGGRRSAPPYRNPMLAAVARR